MSDHPHFAIFSGSLLLNETGPIVWKLTNRWKTPSPPILYQNRTLHFPTILPTSTSVASPLATIAYDFSIPASTSSRSYSRISSTNRTALLEAWQSRAFFVNLSLARSDSSLDTEKQAAPPRPGCLEFTPTSGIFPVHSSNPLNDKYTKRFGRQCFLRTSRRFPALSCSLPSAGGRRRPRFLQYQKAYPTLPRPHRAPRNLTFDENVLSGNRNSSLISIFHYLLPQDFCRYCSIPASWFSGPPGLPRIVKRLAHHHNNALGESSIWLSNQLLGASFKLYVN